ncbi:MAG: PEGA domain-containing protein [Opitutaceae bacterium]|jgi:hypothetical protein|nr:PEGA domain-containing protein [Opitutaceae bacterium]
MKPTRLSAVLILSLVAFGATGCAVITKGRKQEVVVRSTPSGAVTKINGTEVGSTPFKVTLTRSDVFRVDFEKPGFAPRAALLLPSSAEYDSRYIRWGLDYDLGAATDLIPAELSVELQPQLDNISMADRFEEMSAQIVRADALLASGELSASDHKYLVDQIIATYHRAP